MTLPTTHYSPSSKQPIIKVPLTQKAQNTLVTSPLSYAKMVQKVAATAACQSGSASMGSQPTMSHTLPSVSPITPSSQSTCYGNSSSSSSSSMIVAGDTLEALLAHPKENLSREVFRAQKLLKSMYDFVENPNKTQNDFLAVCELLKLSSNNNNAQKLSEQGKKQWLTLLAQQTLAFLSCVNTQCEDVIGWSKLSMHDVSQICYALKASLEPNRWGNYFSDAQLLLLTPELKGITEKLIDHLDHKQLMKPTYQSYGDVLSVLSWMTMGLQLSVPTLPGGETKLLAGSSKDKVGVDTIFKQALNYFSATKYKALDTRQLGKLIYALGRVLNHKLLNLDETDGETTLRQRLTITIFELCKGNALLNYKEWDIDNFDQRELKDRPINPVAVENLADGSLSFLSHLFESSDVRVGRIVNGVTGLIQKALDSGVASKSNLKNYIKFLYKADNLQCDGANTQKIQELIKLVKARIGANSPNS